MFVEFDERASRKALEIKFLLHLRKYLFPPAFQALTYLLVRQILTFEKVVQLMDYFDCCRNFILHQFVEIFWKSIVYSISLRVAVRIRAG